MAPEAPVACPYGSCNDPFTCEACLNVHLQENHGKKYVDVYGAHDPGLTTFCADHGHLSPSVLGI